MIYLFQYLQLIKKLISIFGVECNTLLNKQLIVLHTWTLTLLSLLEVPGIGLKQFVALGEQ